MIVDPANTIAVSATSIWEISIKHALARGKPNDMPISGAEAAEYFRSAGDILPSISPEHATAMEALPPPHADPFDRILVAQAFAQSPRPITHESMVAAYGASILRS
nr:type II toxin-antitoxin system VapC family toxin [Skermanella stibiiresistens]